MKEAIAQQIAQLEQARKHVLDDASHYSAIVPGILPIVGPSAALEIQRWGTDFLAESFASPALSMHTKEALSVQVLETLKGYLQSPADDEYVVKSVVQTTASIYGLIFRHITNYPANTPIWDLMIAIKSNILKRFDTGPIGVRIACIKFMQRIVLVQTPGVITDPRRPDQNEISLALVPRNHPVIPPPNLEAEASGLLDRLLNVFYEQDSDAILVDATLNCLCSLVKSRQSISHRIINVVLNFNPFKQAHARLSTKEKVLLRSMEKTVKAFLLNVCRRPENGTHASKIEQHLSRLEAARIELFENTKKRGPPEALLGLDNAKRARLAEQAPSLPAGPISLTRFFTLTEDQALGSFDVTALPVDLAIKITLSVFQRSDRSQLDNAINSLKKRYLERSQQPSKPDLSLIPVNMEEDEYEPNLDPAAPKEDDEQRGNYTPPPNASNMDEEPALRIFKLPPSQPLSADQTQAWGIYSIQRVFDLVKGTTELSRQGKAGFSRLAGSNRDRETWITIMIRLATRADPEQIDSSNEEYINNGAAVQGAKPATFADSIRESLWRYIVEDFRHRIDIAISWLNEEWYNEKLRSLKQAKKLNGTSSKIASSSTYEKWVLKLLDAIIPYLDANDKILIRFLGEIPEIGQLVLERVKNMARDPDRVLLTVRAI